MPSVIDIIVGLNSTAVGEGVEHIREQVGDMRKDLSSSIGEALSAGALVELAQHTLEYGHEVKSLSEKLGVNSEWIQKVGNVAKLYGADMDTAGAALNKLIVNQQKAIEGGKEQIKNFQRLGISADELVKMQPEELFNRIADATAKATDRGEAYAAVVGVMGRSAGALLPTLEQGSAKIKEQGEAMGVLSSSTIDSLEDADREIKIFEQQVTVIFGSLISMFERYTQAGALMWTNLIGEASIGFETLARNGKRAQEIADNLARVNKDRMQFITTGVDPNAPPEKKGAIDPDRVADDAAAEKEKTKENEKQLKLVEAHFKLQESAAEHELKARMDAMTVEEKIAFLKDRIAKAQDALTNDTDDGKLKTQKYIWEMTEQMETPQKSEDARKASEAKTAAEKAEEYQKKLFEHGKKMEDEAFANRFRALRTEHDKKEALLNRQKQLEAELAKIPKVMIDEVWSKVDEINAVKGQLAEMAGKLHPSIKADSLARIGGGGNVSGMTIANQQLNEAREQTRLLRKIANGGGTGAPNLAP